MSVLSSPSPTLSPKPSFSHDRSFAGLRRVGSSRSYRVSPSGSQVFASHASSPATSVQISTPTTSVQISTPTTSVQTSNQTTPIQISPPTSAPKRRTDHELTTLTSVDAGTQYTPPDYPPTVSRASMPGPVAVVAPGATLPPTTEQDVELHDAVDASDVQSLPPDPPLRRDPHHQTPADSISSGSVSGSTSDVDCESPTKRIKGESNQQAMPRDYTKCNVKDLGIVIADMLMELVRINDPLPFRNDQLTRFHSRAPPGISVHDYLHRLIIHATLTPPILLSLVYYIDKLAALYNVFNISSLTVHRYLITAATVAAKGLSDTFWTNNTYARVGGISVRELALLELDFLQKMDWKIVPPADILVDYYRNLVERNGNYRLDTEEETTE